MDADFFGLTLLPVVEEGGVLPSFEYLWTTVKGFIIGFVKENAYLVAVAAWGAVRAMGTTVQTGYTGLFFSFGRATRVLEPGFVFKIPYFQSVKVMPTRSRTLDVPNQKVTSSDGLVWFVDVNLVYRIADVRKALIEVDDLIYGMEQMLALSVQEIVRASGRESLRNAGELDELIARAMQERLALWGVDVESAGFTSVRPSPKTLKFTQQLHATEERHKALKRLEQRGIEHGLALAMIGSPPILSRRARRATERESRSRRRRRIERTLHIAEKESEQKLRGAERGEIRRELLGGLEATLRPQKLRESKASPSRT